MNDDEPGPFGRRGAVPPPPAPQLPRAPSGAAGRLRSRAVTVGVAGALMFGAYAIAEEAHRYFCPQGDPNDPNSTASMCRYGGFWHGGWGGLGGAHGASFGGFGEAGHGHGGGE
ncbi:MAG: hypothetical protein ABSC22_18535 [Roseiarcus sp.]|jgi:hypothetical protein